MVSLSSNLTIALCHFCEHHGPSVVFHTRLKRSDEGITKLKQVTNNCVACNPLGDEHPGFSSKDPESELETVSSDQYCQSEKFRSGLQHAAFRSLSSEVTPNKEGPIFFSDSGIGINVISYTFFLKDSSARGFQRWFSVIVLSLEASPLLGLWSYLLPEIREIVRDLQQLATVVYQAEEQSCSHRLLRTNLNNFNVGAARALQDLTGNPNILVNLHTKFSVIVLSAANSCSTTALQVCRRQETDEGCSAASIGSVEVLLRICIELGRTNFRRIVKHVLQGGTANISSDNLTLNCSFVESLQLLLPDASCSSFKIANRKLQETQQPYIIITDQGGKLVCVWNTCPLYGKVSCIVTQLEHIIFTENVAPSFILLQLSRIWKQLMLAAKMLKTINQSENDPHRVLQFFQSYGFDSGDMEILSHWSSRA